MFVRWLVSNYLRQVAQRTVMDAVATAAAGSAQRGPVMGGPVAGAAGDPENVASAGKPAPIEPPRCPIVVVCALGIESGGLVDLMSGRSTTKCVSFVEYTGRIGRRSIAVAESGVGREAAGQATEDAIVLHRPAWVVSAGFAGGLVDALAVGDILMADRIGGPVGEFLDIGFKMDAEARARPGFHVGPLVTVDRLIRASAEKRLLAAETGALACDMETSAVADVCRRHRVPFMSVRVISDAVTDELPVEIEKLLNQRSTASRLGAAAAALVRRPSSVQQMWKLHEQAIGYSDRLARFLLGVIAQLPVPEPAPPAPLAPDDPKLVN